MRDAQGCTSECSGTVNAPSAPMCEINDSVNLSCAGAMDGSFEVVGIGGSGAYEYSLDGGPFTSVFAYTNLAAGSYTVTVRNVGNVMCTSSCNITITEPEPLVCVATATDALCTTADDGTSTVSAMGGTGTYTYLWDDAAAQTTTTAVGLVAGTYTVIVTDSNGCTTTCEATVNDPNAISCTTDVINADCSTMTPGSITVNGMGGTPLYEFSIDGTTFQGGNVFNLSLIHI